MQTLHVFRLTATATVPEIATAGSACFDLKADIPTGTKVDMFGKVQFDPMFGSNQQPGGVVVSTENRILLQPGTRAKIPTGLVFDIPLNHSVRLHPRSGVALKKGITLINAEGVVDSDYVEEVCLAVTNLSNESVEIFNGDRLAQAELVENTPCAIVTADSRPARKTERSGGFGSTGTK